MNFQDAEKTYKDFKAQHDAGKLNDAAFEAEVAKLRLQDDQGRWWQIGVQTGEWYVHDGQKWSKAAPPAPKVDPITASAKPTAPTVIPPKPTLDKKVEVTPKPDPASKEPRASTIPRLFSPKPAGREGGLPTRVLVGIIAAVAVVLVLLLIGGYFVLSGALGGAKATPTRAVAVLPTIPPPTLAPLATLAPTLAPLPTLAPVVTTTLSITPTRTRVAFTATPTKKPGTPVPTPTATLNVLPGVYVTKVETVPTKPTVGDTIGFKVTLLNTTGNAQTYKWMVKLYQCPDQCQDFKHSFGETLKSDIVLVNGSAEFTSSQNLNLGTGISCDLIAVPYYIDPASQQPVAFQTAKGGGLYTSFTVCR